jgi:hypothetical protein
MRKVRGFLSTLFYGGPMKTRPIFSSTLIVVAALTLLTTGLTWANASQPGQSSPEAALGTGFTYQGYLTDGGTPANGDYDFSISLYDDETAVIPPLATVLLEDVSVD